MFIMYTIYFEVNRSFVILKYDILYMTQHPKYVLHLNRYDFIIHFGKITLKRGLNEIVLVFIFLLLNYTTKRQP